MHKEIRKVVKEAEKLGFTIKRLDGHTWGWIVCSCGKHTQVFSTGKNPEGGARLIKAWIDKHKEHV
ncbi:hypothetical protein [Myceligenerans pegani]|uniref:HicA-like toxin n=1 Tax=Myceligenerans pegani TaxID=2776917 RepID=A0ABR9MXZ9_9MICO|nr:hypothetical protein [Myceligenerans sp. TRM 65318]MBE1875995.1 hypothetical protein [Myceligenerans sp. TRM 65318]MBE3018266.1 hypothetical protein [Myceligenerans sp. TRM 65318]